MERPKVVIVGGGPAALACAHALRAEPTVDVVMVAPGGSSSYLAGALAVATRDAAVDRFRAPLRLDGVEVLDAVVEQVEEGRVHIDGEVIVADAVVVAAGLATDTVADADHRVVGFWDLDSAAGAADTVSGFHRGSIGVVIGGPLYRCPPAPYGLAIRLARRAERLGLDVRVTVTTPEARPLAAIGSAVTALLVDSCRDAGVEVRYDTSVDPDALADGRVIVSDGSEPGFDLSVVIPPHRAHPLVRRFAGPNQLVEVDDGGRSPMAGVYVAGDAVASPFPRAAAPATTSGLAAAAGVLVDLGVRDGVAPGLPEPDCFVDQGNGDYSRIRISYPSGPPPAAIPTVAVGGVDSAATGGFDAAVERWRAACGTQLA